MSVMLQHYQCDSSTREWIRAMRELENDGTPHDDASQPEPARSVLSEDDDYHPEAVIGYLGAVLGLLAVSGVMALCAWLLVGAP